MNEKEMIKIPDKATHRETIIREIASDMYYGCTKRDLYPKDAKAIAEALYLLNYRKIPEGSVVLSKEEYELYDVVKKGYPNDMTCLAEKFTQIDHKARKETAEEFAKAIKTKLEEISSCGLVDESIAILNGYINKIKKQVAVEVGE